MIHMDHIFQYTPWSPGSVLYPYCIPQSKRRCGYGEILPAEVIYNNGKYCPREKGQHFSIHSPGQISGTVTLATGMILNDKILNDLNVIHRDHIFQHTPSAMMASGCKNSRPLEISRSSGCISQYIPPLGSVRIQYFT